MKKIFVGLVAVGLLTVGLSAGAFHISRFSTRLTGSAEVPPVTTASDGRFSARLNSTTNTIDFRLSVDDAQAVTMAHLHCAPVGQAGPIVATLFGTIPGGFDVDGQLANFTLTNANIESTASTCSPAITTMAQLMQAIRDGRIYVNVHTVAHPAGEIRGQLNSPLVSPTTSPTTSPTPS